MSVCRLALLGWVTTLLCGCPPPDPSVNVIGIVAQRSEGGRSRLTMRLTNGGYADYEGDLCLRVTWLKNARFTLEGDAFVQSGGEVVDEARVCRWLEIDVGEDATRVVESTSAVAPGTFAIVVREPIPNESDIPPHEQVTIVSAD